MAKKILIVAARFNERVSKSLLEGALGVFDDAGISHDDIETLWVPGAFETPVVAAKAARSGHYQSIVCLGCVIRGETPHFDYVAGQAAAGLMKVSIETEIPVVFGILTTDTVEQALNRSGLKHGNKGVDAAHAALSMARVMGRLEEVRV